MHHSYLKKIRPASDKLKIELERALIARNFSASCVKGTVNKVHTFSE